MELKCQKLFKRNYKNDFMKLSLLALIGLFSITSYSQIIFVNKDAVGLDDGTNWENAYKSLDFATKNTITGEIWVALGTYYPETDRMGEIPSNSRRKSFVLKPNVSLYGGFNGTETSREQRNYNQNITILSGELGNPNSLLDNSFHVIEQGTSQTNAETIIDGFTIRDGYTAINGYGGGGLDIYDFFIMRNCILENNYSLSDGGAIRSSYSNAIIEDNIFRNNHAFQGGAIALIGSDALIKNNVFYNNVCDDINGNSSTSNAGGALHVTAYSSPIITDNIFQGNYAKVQGGAVDLESNYSVVFQNNILFENSSEDGGALYIDGGGKYLFNNVFAKNTASHDGGAIYLDYVNTLECINNTIVDNTADHYGGGIMTSGAGINMVNTILYGNTSFDNYQIVFYFQIGGFYSKIRFSDIENGIDGIGRNGPEDRLLYEDNFDIEPEFVDSNDNNYRLEPNSLLINNGTFSNEIIQTPWQGTQGEEINFPLIDVDGNPRIINTIDLGAYEYGVLDISNFENERLIVYPNPTNGLFSIKNIGNFNNVTVHDVLGKKIIDLNLKTGINKLDLSIFASGIYHLKFISPMGNLNKKIILLH